MCSSTIALLTVFNSTAVNKIWLALSNIVPDERPLEYSTSKLHSFICCSRVNAPLLEHHFRSSIRIVQLVVFIMCQWAVKEPNTNFSRVCEFEDINSVNHCIHESFQVPPDIVALSRISDDTRFSYWEALSFRKGYMSSELLIRQSQVPYLFTDPTTYMYALSPSSWGVVVCSATTFKAALHLSSYVAINLEQKYES